MVSYNPSIYVNTILISFLLGTTLSQAYITSALGHAAQLGYNQEGLKAMTTCDLSSSHARDRKSLPIHFALRHNLTPQSAFLSAKSIQEPRHSSLRRSYIPPMSFRPMVRVSADGGWSHPLRSSQGSWKSQPS